MAEGGRLETVAEAVADGLRGFRRGETSVSELASVFRERLGPRERLFIASAAATALSVEHKDELADMLAREVAREDPRGCTERAYGLLIEIHRLVGDEDKAREREQALAGIRARWAADDTWEASENA